jgi:hypothetical protein
MRSAVNALGLNFDLLYSHNQIYVLRQLQLMPRNEWARQTNQFIALTAINAPERLGFQWARLLGISIELVNALHSQINLLR